MKAAAPGATTSTMSGTRMPSITGTNIVAPARPASACSVRTRSWRQPAASCRRRGATLAPLL